MDGNEFKATMAVHHRSAGNVYIEKVRKSDNRDRQRSFQQVKELGLIRPDYVKIRPGRTREEDMFDVEVGGTHQLTRAIARLAHLANESALGVEDLHVVGRPVRDVNVTGPIDGNARGGLEKPIAGATVPPHLHIAAREAVAATGFEAARIGAESLDLAVAAVHHIGIAPVRAQRNVRRIPELARAVAPAPPLTDRRPLRRKDLDPSVAVVHDEDALVIGGGHGHPQRVIQPASGGNSPDGPHERRYTRALPDGRRIRDPSQDEPGQRNDPREPAGTETSER